MLGAIFGTIGGIFGIGFVTFLELENKYRKEKELHKANICRNWSCLSGTIAISCLLVATIL